MTSCSSAATHRAGLAFDSIAEQYDDIFTRSRIGRAQRAAVWPVLQQIFRVGERVLELNCGTGEDALFLARTGVSVYGCDASERMIAVAARRIAEAARGAQVQLEVRSTEAIGELRDAGDFDGVLSNFSGLNCVADLGDVASHLARLVKPEGRLVLCFSSRLCLWETLWYMAHGQVARALRRLPGKAAASLGEVVLDVRYPTVWHIRRLFAPHFVLRGHKGIGVTVPPSYLEPWARRHPKALSLLQAIDQAVAGWFLLRGIGDHTLLVLERTRS